MQVEVPTSGSQDFVLRFQNAEPDTALPLWEERLSKFIASMDVKPRRDEGVFNAVWRHLDLGCVGLNVIQSPPQRVWREPERECSLTGAGLDLLIMTRNSIWLEHAGCCRRVDQGHMVVLDHSQPFLFESSDPIESITLHVDRDWLAHYLPNFTERLGKPLDVINGWGGPVGAMARAMASAQINDMRLPRSDLANQLGALLSLISCHHEIEPTAGVMLWQRLQALLLQRYSEPGLNPALAAGELGISRRYLHLLCARQGTTFTEQLITVRLEKARELLQDRRFQRIRIAEIAQRCGFVDASHFARRFRQQYGAAPGHFRH